MRAGTVSRAEDYSSSSYRAKTGMSAQPGLDLGHCYLGLGSSPAERAEMYASFASARIASHEYELIHYAVHRNQLTGDLRFVDEVEQRTGARIELSGRGRPAVDRDRSGHTLKHLLAGAATFCLWRMIRARRACPVPGVAS